MRKRSQNRQNSSKAPWLAATLMATTATADHIKGIGYRENAKFIGRNKLSMMGGAKFMIRADGGLNDQAGSNYIQYKSEQIEGMPDMHSALSHDDEFYSNPSEGKLAFTTPSVMELFNAEISDFNGSGFLPNGWGSDKIKL